MRVIHAGGFPEGLRWHDGELWFSDLRSRDVWSWAPASGLTRRAFIPGQPSGLGWWADDTLLVSSMLDGLLVAVRPSGKDIVASLGRMTTGPINDMLVDAAGRAYVGSLGFDPTYAHLGPDDLTPERIGSAVQAVPLLLVGPDGSVTVAADDLVVPNGMALLDEGRTLVVAETLLGRLTAFDVATDGRLVNRRVHAELPGPPDGICAGGDGTVWAGLLMAERFVQVSATGEIIAEVATPGRVAVDCALGGPDGRTLFGAVVAGAFDLWGGGTVSGAIESWEI